MSDLPKKLKKEINSLIEIAYSRELDKNIGQLAQKFDAWRKNEIDSWTLNDFIHTFHDGESRELYKKYNIKPNEFLVAQCLKDGYLNTSELSDELLKLTSRFNQFHKTVT